MVAPASPFDVDEFWRGLAWLRGRYLLRASPRLLRRTGYLAGDDDRRADELSRAMLDGEVKAIVAARGGYGAMRILERLPWDEFALAPRWLVGFSDITALHVMAWSRGVASIHAPHVTGLASAAPVARAAWIAALERPTARRSWANLRVVHPGRARGPFVGGNLALVEAMAASGRLRMPDGAVLALEDVTERPYRVDRMLTSLALGGHFARLSAIVFGSFARCEPGAGGVAVEDVLAERTASLGIPVLAGAPFGHGGENDAFVLGMTAEVRGTEVTLAAP